MEKHNGHKARWLAAVDQTADDPAASLLPIADRALCVRHARKLMTFERHRNKDGEINRKHGDTMVSTLRSIYGPSFAPDFQPTAMLSDVLDKLDEPSLTHLIHDHEAGRLHGKIAEKS